MSGQHQRVLLFNDIVKFSNLFPDLDCSLRRLEITDASPGSCTLTTPGDFLHGNPGIGTDVFFLASSFLHLLFPFLALLMLYKDTNTHFKRQDHSLRERSPGNETQQSPNCALGVCDARHPDRGHGADPHRVAGRHRGVGLRTGRPAPGSQPADSAGSHSAWAWAEARAAFHGRPRATRGTAVCGARRGVRPRVSRLTGGTRKIRDCARGKLNNSEQSVTFERGIPKRCYHRHTAS